MGTLAVRFGRALGNETIAFSVVTVSGDVDGTLGIVCEGDNDDDDDIWDGVCDGETGTWMSWDESVTVSSIVGTGNGKMLLLKISGGCVTVISWKGKICSWKTTLRETEIRFVSKCNTLYPLYHEA